MKRDEHDERDIKLRREKREDRIARERHIMKKRERELKNVAKPKNSPDELSHNDSKKIPVGRIIRSLVLNLTRFFSFQLFT